MENKLGFGTMRLPTLSADQKDIDYEQVNKMFDEFLNAGFNYFDTSYVYHGGASEPTIKKCLTSRYPREKFILTSKLPIFKITQEDEIDKIFNEQLEKCGVDYFDYYLLHNMNILHYERQVQTCHAFEHMKKFKAEGKIKHIGLSLHDSADVLDKILTEHPEVEVVQIVVNYLDWDSYFIQSKKCYEVVRKHGKQVLIMEPVKGGALAKIPEKAEKIFKTAAPENSVASWAIRFAANLDGVLRVLSGMSSLEQVKDNISTMKNAKPLSADEQKIIAEVSKICRENGPVGLSDYKKFEKINPKGISAAAILDTYNNCIIQPVPAFAAEHSYFCLEKAKNKIQADEKVMPEKILLDGEDFSKIVHEAEDFLYKTMFYKYEVR